MAFVQGMSLLTFAAMARYLSAHDFGLVSLCYATIQVIKNVFIDGIAGAVLRKPKAEDAEYTTVFWITVAASLLAFAGFELSSGVLERWFGAAGLQIILQQMSIIVLVMGLSRTHECWMNRHFQFRTLAVRSIVSASLSGIVGVILAMCHFGLLALVAQQILVNVVSLITLWVSCPWRPRLTFSRSCAIEVWHFTSKTIPGNLSAIAAQTFDTFLITYFAGVSATGLYSMAKRLRLALQLIFSTPISAVAMPSLADARRHPETEKATVLSTLFILSLICAPAFAGASSVSKDAIDFAFGDRWASVAPIFSYLALCGYASVLLGYCDTVFFVLGRPVYSFYVTGLYIAFVLASFSVIGLYFPNTNIATPFTLPFLVTLPLSLSLVCRVAGVAGLELGRTLLPSLVSAVCMTVVLRAGDPLWSHDQPAVRLAAKCLLGAVTYLVFAIAAGGHRTKSLLATLASVKNLTGFRRALTSGLDAK